MKRDRRTPVLIALVLAMALVAMDTTIVATAIPQVVGDLGGISEVGWVFSAYLLAQTVTIPICGKLADLYGRKPVLVIGVMVFLIGSALSASSWNMVALIAFRALQGLGAGAIGATVNTVAGDMYNVQERGRVQGYLSSVWGISAVVAPAIGGFFAQYASWRWIFLINLPTGALALFLIVRGLHENVTLQRHRIDYAGASLVLLSVGMLILGLLEGGTTWAWDSVGSITTFAIAVVAGIAAIAVERRAAEPMLPPWLWSKRLTAATYAATIAAGMITIGLSVYLPTWGQQVLGLSPVGAGFMLASMSMTWPVASGYSARLYLRIGFRDTAVLGALLAMVAGVELSLLGPHAAVWQPVLGTMVMGAGMGLVFTPLIVGLQNTVGWSQRGTITGGAMFSRFLGQSLGAAAYGAIFNAGLRAHADVPEALRVHESTHLVFLGLLLAAVLTAALLAILVPRRFPAYDDGLKQEATHA